MEDDVSEEIKARRLQEIVDLQQKTRLVALRTIYWANRRGFSRKFQKIY
jgi:hypothetical protein